MFKFLFVKSLFLQVRRVVGEPRKRHPHNTNNGVLPLTRRHRVGGILPAIIAIIGVIAVVGVV